MGLIAVAEHNFTLEQTVLRSTKFHVKIEFQSAKETSQFQNKTR